MNQTFGYMPGLSKFPDSDSYAITVIDFYVAFFLNLKFSGYEI